MSHYFRSRWLSSLLLGLTVVILMLVAFVPANLTAAPQANGEFVSVSPYEPAYTLDPALAYDSSSAEVLQQIYETLLLVDKDSSEYAPQLAGKWDISANADEYVFYLRRGLTFQDGKALLPEDVAYSIQRGLLQSDSGSPQWLLIRPIMGNWYDIAEGIDGGAWVGDQAGLIANADPGELRAVCEEVKQRVTADDKAGTVTFSLSRSDSSFPDVLATYGFVIDQGWATAQGDWDGSCDTWQNFYAPSSTEEGSRLSEKANGSGPFELQAWSVGTELTLARHDGYWGGPAALSKIVYKVIEDRDQRLQMLLSGQADKASLYQVDLSDEVLMEMLNGVITLNNPSGILKAYSGMPQTSATDAFFTYQISNDGGNPYIGSGQLDGNGIPPDFFSDIHVRKAFSYAFDYAAYNNRVYGGRAIRRTGPIIANLMGYAPTQPTYDYNLGKAKQELAQAWGGQIPGRGFRMTLLYNEGNVTRQAVAEIIEQGIEALDPKYQIEVTSASWPDTLKAIREGKLPIFISGWAQDYAHPENWLGPYLYNIYADRARLPNDLQDMYEAQSNACLKMTGSAARACYEGIQVDTHERAVQLYLLQDTSVQYVRAEVRGFDQALRYHAYPYYYVVSKETAPDVTSWSPGSMAEISVDAAGTAVTIDVPETAFEAAAEVVTEASSDVRDKGTVGYFVSDAAFALTAFDQSGMELAAEDWKDPLTVTIGAESVQQARVTGDVHLLLWKGSYWADETCGDYDFSGDVFSVPICKPGLYAVGEETEIGFMPVVRTP